MQQDEFKKLFDYLFPHVWRYSWKITKDKDEGEDIAINSMCAAWEKINDFGTIKEFTKFVYTSAKNASINYLHKSKSRNAYNRHLAYSSEQEQARDIDFFTYQSALIERLHKEIEKLPPKCRDVVRLCYLDGLPRLEAAKRLNLTIDTVNSQCLIAIKKFRTIFKEL
jgi:RNA polymerase sigma-70 factor (ECF subfamily)